jgi:chromosome segregation ATPase
MQNRLALVAFLLLAALLLACGMAKKANECSALIDRINTAQQEASSIQFSMDTSTDDIKKMADVFEKLGKDLDAMEISTDELKGYRDEYKAMAAKAGKAAHNLAEAVEKTDQTKFDAAQKELNEATDPEDALVDKINTFCSAP